MCMPKVAAFFVVLMFALGSSAAFSQSPNLGKPINPADIAAWDISVLPDGTGLPSGSGTPADGARIFAAKCAACHGQNAKGGVNAALVGGAPVKDMESEKTVANFWPFATTLFDYIRRAMPWRQPRSLTNEEVYSVTAYILSLNKIIGENDTMNAQTLPKVQMPNRNGFIVRFPERIQP
jgi:S-disulfanyl-L-cysteine oxidoreductase SoxD